MNTCEIKLRTGFMNITSNGTYYPALTDAIIKKVTVNVPLTTKTIRSNGTYNASDDGYSGYSSVIVNLPSTEGGDYLNRQDMQLPIADNGIVNLTSQLFTPGYGSYSSFRLAASTQNMSITSNGVYYPDSNSTIVNKITVNVPSSTFTTKSITSNGTYNASSDGYDGYSSVDVNVTPNVTTASSTVSFETFSQPSNNNQTTSLQNKYFYALSSGYDGFSSFVYSLKIQYITINSNGTYYPTDDNTAIRKVIVDVPTNTLTTKTITSNGTYYASNDGYDGYSSVTVSGIPTVKSIWRVKFPYDDTIYNFNNGAYFSNTTMTIPSGYCYIFFNKNSNEIRIVYNYDGMQDTFTTSFASTSGWRLLRNNTSPTTSNFFTIEFYNNSNVLSDTFRLNTVNGHQYSFSYDYPMTNLKIG